MARQALKKNTFFRLSPSAFLLVFALAALLSAPAAAQPYPTRPLRIVSPFSAGGNSDIVGRLLAPKLAERLGQNVIVENRPGAGGMIGTAYVVRATPDGHTMLAMSGAFTAVAATVAKLPYDPARDFSWVTMIVTYPFVVVVKSDSPVKTVGQFIAAAKRSPGKLAYGSVGTGSVFHLAAELFNTMAGTDMTHIPYKGGGEPIAELMGGRLDVIFTTLTGAYGHIEANRVRPIAVASARRAPQLPDVPSVAETLPGYEVTSFLAVAGPRGVPAPVVARLNREYRAVLALPDIHQRLTASGGEVRPGTPAELARHMTDEISKWKRVVAEKKIEVQ
jgi:tripartite-type tricarboxylate transporter receptor subunit TctC